MFAVKTVLMLFNIYAMKYNFGSSNVTDVDTDDVRMFLNYSDYVGASMAMMDFKDLNNSGIKVLDVINGSTDLDPLSAAKEAARNRRVVKLNMKQTLIMNQAISIYALTDSSDSLCRNHSKEFQDGLRAFEPWALQMFDSSSKLQSGILTGNLMDFGSFKQCVQISFRSQYGEVTGKHCAIRIRPSEKVLMKMMSYRNVTARRYSRVKSSIQEASLYWTVCIPESCSPEDALRHFNKSLMSVLEGLDVEISLSDMDCYSKKEELALSRNETIVLYIILGYLTVIIACTILDIWYRRKNVPRKKCVEVFSVYSNVAYIASSREEGGKLDCLNGIRFISICYIIVGHKYLMALFFPVVNTLDILDWFLEYPSTIILGGTVSVDTFFVMSGLLVSYHFFDYMSNGGKFNYGLFCIHRYIRLTPSYGAIVLLAATFAHRLGSGPLWKKVCTPLQQNCQQFWWSALLYIQSYVNPKLICLLQTWYMSCEMQFYLISPIIMYPLWKWKGFGVVNLIILYITSVCINFYIAWTNEYKVGMLMDTQLQISDFFTTHYIMPYVRASPYILGIGFGYILQKTKNLKIRMGKATLIVGWLSSFTLLATVILTYNRFELEDYEYNRFEQSAFLSLHRSVWAVGLMWIIWACRSGYGGPINSFLSLQVFQIFGRITYSMFLVHIPFQFLALGSLKLPIHFSNFDCVHSALGDMCLSMAFGFLLTILVEYPCVRISLLVFKARRRTVIPKDK